jgi:hypothetical protein
MVLKQLSSILLSLAWLNQRVIAFLYQQISLVEYPAPYLNASKWCPSHPLYRCSQRNVPAFEGEAGSKWDVPIKVASSVAVDGGYTGLNHVCG